jgi:hypothetical protein
MNSIPALVPAHVSADAVVWRAPAHFVLRFGDIFSIMQHDGRAYVRCGVGLAGRQRAMELAGVALYDSDQTPSPDSADPYHAPWEQFADDGQPEAPEPIPARYRE